MPKFMEIEDSGYVWRIPLEVIADRRAKHYADDPDSSYQEEFDYTMEDDFEAIDWFQNNMDFADVEDKAELVEVPEPMKAPSDFAEVVIVER